MKNRILLFCFSLWLVVPALQAQTTDKNLDKKLKKLDEMFSVALTDFNVPGMSISIVKNDEVVFAKGYGVKSSLTGELVDEHTLFPVASNTKSFTVASLAMLVDSGKIAWSDKVKKYLPYFSLYSPYVTDEMTVRDLLCHRSGLATFSGDLVWYGTDYSRQEVIERAAHLEPVYGFRETYGYNNIMFIAAGEIIPAVTGKSWDDYVKEKIFVPAGMTSSLTSVRDFHKATNLALPHNEVDGKNVPIDFVNWDNIGGAGAINSSAMDMAQWLRLQLGKGTIDGKTLWREDRTWEMWENQVSLPLNNWQRTNVPSRHFRGYGLGWELMDYGGCKVVSHGGGYDGMISKSVLIPELNLGFVILTNNNNALPSCLTYEILDVFTGNESSVDWLELFLGFKKEGEAEALKQKEEDEKARIKNTNPSLDLQKYCGTYHSELYGDIKIALVPGGNELAIEFVPTPLFSGKLSHWHYDTFVLSWNKQMMLPGGKATFILNQSGEAEELRIDAPNPDFDFTELKLFKVAQN